MADPTEFAPHQRDNIVWGGIGGHVGYDSGVNEKGLVVWFYNRSVHQKAQSVAEGRPIHKDVTYVHIAPPGEKLNIVDRPATGADARRFPTQWQQFTTNKQQTPDGTPVDLLYPDSPSVGATLRASGVYTVEQLAELSGHAIDNVGMGAQQWVNAAQKYLAAANKGVKLTQYRHDLEERDRQVAFLSKQVEELTQTIAKMRDQEVMRGNMALQSLVASNLPRPTHMPQQAFDPEQAMINDRGRTERLPSRAKPRLRG